MNRIYLRALAMAMGWLWTTASFGWGSEGHQAVASLAQGQLSAKAHAEVDRLLALEPEQTLVTISTWAARPRLHGTTLTSRGIPAPMTLSGIVRTDTAW
jgi:hypothetical protein